jgi:hypothetical protein
MLRACAREPEVAEAIRSGRWPLGCEPELRAHVEECRHCREMAMLTAAFQEARAQAVGAAEVPRAGMPNAGLLWWRAQLRRRNAAMARVNRPLAGAQGFALLALLVAGVALAGWLAREGVRWFGWWDGVRQAVAGVNVPAMLHGAGTLGFVVAGSVALLGGVAAWLAAER